MLNCAVVCGMFEGAVVTRFDMWVGDGAFRKRLEHIIKRLFSFHFSKARSIRREVGRVKKIVL